jgi:hypothetical protein
MAKSVRIVLWKARFDKDGNDFRGGEQPSPRLKNKPGPARS